MTTALVTGGLGLIGSAICRILVEENVCDRIVILDHYGEYVSPMERPDVEYRKMRFLDIKDKCIIERGQAHYPNVIGNILGKYKPDFIFHLAALPLASLQNANSQEAIEGSVVSTSHLLELCGLMKASTGWSPRRFVYCSSSMVYGDFVAFPAPETHPTNPKEIYGTMKLAGEVATRGLATVYGIPSTIIRPSAVYGPTDMNRRVTQIFVENALLGKPLVVNGDDEKLDFTFVDDAARGFVLAAVRPEAVGETFNITAGHAHTLLEFAQELQRTVPGVVIDIKPRDATRPRRGTLDITKARECLGFAPRVSLAEGVRRYVEWARTLATFAHKGKSAVPA